MSLVDSPQITLEQAKLLVTHLENKDVESANRLFFSISSPENSELFDEIGKLTRQLHDSLQSFQLDARISNIATEDIPDAKERLSHVISMTEEAANTTMDAVESSLPIAESLHQHLSDIRPSFARLMARDLKVGEFKELCHKLNEFIEIAEKDSSKLQTQLNEVLMAQGFQDLTGQILRRVIELVREVEDSLIHLLTMFGTQENNNEVDESELLADASKPEGPIINADERDDVVSGQDDVDDLLSSLGF